MLQKAVQGSILVEVKPLNTDFVVPFDNEADQVTVLLVRVLLLGLACLVLSLQSLHPEIETFL